MKDAAIFSTEADGHAGTIEMAHVVSTDLIATVGQPAREGLRSRGEQQGGAVDRACGKDHDAPAEGAFVGFYRLDAAAVGAAEELVHPCPGLEADIGVLQGRPHPADLGIALGMEQTRKSIAAGAAHTGAARRVVLQAMNGER